MLKYILLSIFLLMNVPVNANTLNGAGATFPAPLYFKWAEQSRLNNFNINYQAIGSGAGQTQIINKTVDFGASDAPMESHRLKQDNLMQFPTVLGSVVVIVNIPGIDTNTIRISGKNLVDIYTGKINKWNDPALISDNPTLKLPNLSIAPIYRADGSGTTFVFVKYLHSQNKIFSPPAVSIKWPIGLGARGNDGVALSVKRISGSIGYVENAFAVTNKIPIALLQSSNNTWVEANIKTFEKTLNHLTITDELEINIDTKNCNNCYPIISATYIIIPIKSEKMNDITSWIEWVFKNGDKSAVELDYIPLPKHIKEYILKTLKNG